MARESGAEAAAEAANPAGGAASRTSGLVAVLALVVGVALGGAGGVFGVGPMLTKDPAPETAEEEGGGEAEAESGHGGAKGAAAVHLLENLVVNPAESQGLRFLVVTVALEADRPAVLEDLAAKDAEVRDALLRLFGGKTVGELADVAKREALKEEVRAMVSGALTAGKIRRVYLPQFVIQ